jgi:hypothetical protein
MVYSGFGLDRFHCIRPQEINYHSTFCRNFAVTVFLFTMSKQIKNKSLCPKIAHHE